MQVVVHMGTGKAGSTALQHSLLAARKELLDRGYLFPTLDGKPIPPKRLLEAITREAPPAASAAVWERILEQVDRERPRKLVLSNEHLWKHSGMAATMHDRLRSLGGELSVYLYIREPLSYYRSVAQQALRSTHLLPVPGQWRPPLTQHLSRLWTVFGSDMTVVPFQRSSLLGDGMLKDFSIRALNDRTGPFHLPERRANASPPAEVTEAVQMYQKQLYPDGEAVFRSDVVEYETRLHHIARREGLGTRARLKEEVADTLLASNRDILVRLKDEWGIEFEDIDYEGLDDRTHHPDHSHVVRFSEICDVNPSHLERIMILLTKELLS